MIPPTVDFLVQNPSSKVRVAMDFNVTVDGVHRYLQVVREYLIVKRATLLMAMRSSARGEAIFRINSKLRTRGPACP